MRKYEKRLVEALESIASSLRTIRFNDNHSEIARIATSLEIIAQQKVIVEDLEQYGRIIATKEIEDVKGIIGLDGDIKYLVSIADVTTFADPFGS